MDFAVHFFFGQEKKQIILYLAKVQRILSNADPNKLMSFSAYHIVEGTFSVPANALWFVYCCKRHLLLRCKQSRNKIIEGVFSFDLLDFVANKLSR